ncbi:MAG: zinc dependent phospholipase C family protein [Lachnospiraceae bacterium]
MPGFTTHYLFGFNTYKDLKSQELKQSLKSNHAAYSLGLQGPDLFFYFLPSYLIHKNNIGSVAHTTNTHEFLYYLLKSRTLFPSQIEQSIAQSYIAGFIGHYVLDTHCHPYVYWNTHFQEKNNHYYGAHVTLEVDIDQKLLADYKQKLPSQFPQTSTILLSSLQRRTIATILYYVYSKVYPDLHICYATMKTSIASIQLGTKLLHDPSGRKKILIRKLEQILLGYPMLSCLIPSDCTSSYQDPLNIRHRQWRNPWDKTFTSKATFLDLMEHSQLEYTVILEDLYQLFHTKTHTPLEQKRTAHLLLTLGNNSYHSGIDWKIPS